MQAQVTLGTETRTIEVEQLPNGLYLGTGENAKVFCKFRTGKQFHVCARPMLRQTNGGFEVQGKQQINGTSHARPAFAVKFA